MGDNKPSRKLFALDGELNENGFDNIERYIISRSEDRARFECYASDGAKNYTTAEYMGDVVLITRKLQDPVGFEAAKEQDTEGLIGRPTE